MASSGRVPGQWASSHTLQGSTPGVYNAWESAAVSLLVLGAATPIPPHGHCRGAQIFYCGPFGQICARTAGTWILPILAIALMFGGLFILGQSSVLTPFIYTLF